MRGCMSTIELRQNATISSLKMSFNPHNEHILIIYTAYDMHFDKGIETSSNIKKINKSSECYGTINGIYEDYPDLLQSVFNRKWCRLILKHFVQHHCKQYH